MTFFRAGSSDLLFKNASFVRREASILNVEVISIKVASVVCFPEELQTEGPDCLRSLSLHEGLLFCEEKLRELGLFSLEETLGVGNPAHGRGVEARRSLWSFSTQAIL